MEREVREYSKEYIMVNKEFISDTENYTHREQFIYTVLQGIKNDLSQSSIISIDMLTEILGLSAQTKNRTAVKELLLSMEEKNLISVYEDVLCTRKINVSDIKVTGTYAIRINEVDTERNYFTILELKYLYQFINMKEKYKELYFAIYINIVSRLYNNETSRKFAFPNIDTIERETGINKKTIMKYVSILKDNSILYYETVRIGKDKDKNLYGKWHDISHVSEAVRRVENGEEIKDI